MEGEPIIHGEGDVEVNSPETPVTSPAKKGALVGKMRENPWILSTLVLGVLALVLMVGDFSGGGGMTGMYSEDAVVKNF